MSFLEELTSKLADASTLASQKTQEITQSVKVQNIVFKEKKKRDELLRTLGTMYYEKYKDTDESEFQDILSQITSVEESIQSYSVDKTLKTDQCPSCHQFIEKGLAFCPHCGVNLKNTSESIIESVDTETVIFSTPQNQLDDNNVQLGSEKFCTNCGTTLPEEAMFCVECGTSL